jgi:diguanylate cyclase (GGDEF)-like protein/PAS domain S-box-containing protein
MKPPKLNEASIPEAPAPARKRAPKPYKKSDARLRRIVDSNMMGIIVSDHRSNIIEANDAFLKMVGYTLDDIPSGELRLADITPPEHRRLDEQALEKIEASGACTPFEKEYIRKDGSRVPVLFCAALLEESQQGLICFVLDLTEYKKGQEKINYLAYHDALTDLPNQVLFKDRLQQALALACRSEQMLAVMLINLDRFNTINDTLGYAAGDRFLQEVAERLIICVRESDTVARFGGDEFALILTQINRTEDAAKIAQDIKEAFNRPFDFNNQEIFITISIGIGLYPYDGKDIPNLLKSAGAALCRAKEQDGNNYQFYTAGRTTMALKQLLLENNLRPGLARGEFIIQYQPQVNIHTGQLVGMEALVRWQHPVLGLLLPAEFIHLAEDSGLITSIGEWVLRTACMQNKCWQNAGFDPLRMAVNLSARQFQLPKLVETVAQILKETELEPGCLELELTEGSIMKNPEQAIGKLHQLKRMGIKIAVDDFGTGYSSLSYLKRFPIDTLKIDRSFIIEISTNSADAAIVRAIITLARALELNVIAEGVENFEQLEFLRLLECDEVQGFLFSKSLSAEDFEQLLMERRRFNSRGDYSTTRLPSLSNNFQMTG